MHSINLLQTVNQTLFNNSHTIFDASLQQVYSVNKYVITMHLSSKTTPSRLIPNLPSCSTPTTIYLQYSNHNAMKTIRQVRRRNLIPRVVGFDDAPFSTSPRVPGSEVHSVGIVTSGDRFEGMLYVGGIHQDGLNAGDQLAAAIEQSKFHAQIHAVLLDGVTMGGLNVIDIHALARRVQRPVVAVMRAQPNMGRMLNAISFVASPDARIQRIENAGPVHVIDRWIFQYRTPGVVNDSNTDIGAENAKADTGGNTDKESGTDAIVENVGSGSDSCCGDSIAYDADVDKGDIVWLLTKCTPEGTQKIPECLRMAHLIGAAIKTGQSSSSA